MHVSLNIPPLFQADSGTNLIKQGGNVNGRPCGSVAQLAESLHGKRETFGSSPGRAMIVLLPCDTCIYLDDVLHRYEFSLTSKQMFKIIGKNVIPH